MNPRIPRGVYAITPDREDSGRLLREVERVLDAGVALLQYRNKQGDAALRAEQATALAALCARARVPLIINDDVDLAVQIGAAGVHLGEHDGDIMQARALLGPDRWIGVSCYDDIDRARRAAAAGADYLAFGAFFDSPTKPAARRAGTALLHEAASLGLPLVAIGGLLPENARDVVAGGADLLAVISGIFDAPDPVAAVAAYRACFDAEQQSIRRSPE